MYRSSEKYTPTCFGGTDYSAAYVDTTLTTEGKSNLYYISVNATESPLIDVADDCLPRIAAAVAAVPPIMIPAAPPVAGPPPPPPGGPTPGSLTSSFDVERGIAISELKALFKNKLPGKKQIDLKFTKETVTNRNIQRGVLSGVVYNSLASNNDVINIINKYFNNISKAPLNYFVVSNNINFATTYVDKYNRDGDKPITIDNIAEHIIDWVTNIPVVGSGEDEDPQSSVAVAAMSMCLLASSITATATTTIVILILILVIWMVATTMWEQTRSANTPPYYHC